MKKSYLLWVTAPAFILYLTLTGTLPASRGRYPEVPGCLVKLTPASIDLVFPDGSVLRTSNDFDRLNLDGVKASGGMADELFKQAYDRLQNDLRKPSGLPGLSCLDENQPNPFSPSTAISYTVASENSPVEVRLDVFDLRGQLVRTLVDTVQPPGDYSYFWQGYDEKGQALKNGVYYCRLRAGSFVATRKILVIK